MSEWLPIETAPKDQQVLLGRAGEPGMVVGVIDSEVPDMLWTGGDFVPDHGATHWMPLPSPPSANAVATPADEGKADPSRIEIER